jgi:hypothetical protein
MCCNADDAPASVTQGMHLSKTIAANSPNQDGVQSQEPKRLENDPLAFHRRYVEMRDALAS